MLKHWEEKNTRWKVVPGNGSLLALVLPSGKVVSWGNDYPDGPTEEATND